MAEHQLPEGWTKTHLGSLSEFVMGQAPSSKDCNTEGVGEVFVKAGEFGDIRPITKEWTTNPLKFAQEGDVLICVVGATAGKINLGMDCAIGRSVAAIRPMSPVSQLFIYRYIQSRVLHIRSDSTGSAQGVISKQDLEKIEVPLAPFAEQQVIADTLDRLLAQVERSKARLQRIPQLLKRFRQSVLAVAVSGKLTEEWRSNNPSYVTVWRQTTFSSICTEITVGYVGKMIDRYKDSGIAFLRSQNVKPFKFSSQNLLYISEAFHNEIYKSRLEPGDLAIVRSGAPGTTCVIPKGIGPANCSDLVIARPSKDLISEFGCIFMNSEVAQKNVADNQVGVAQQHFNVGSMKKMPISLPSLEEQTEIVRRVEQLFVYADRIEQQAKAALARVNHLTQAILAKAFRGELTEQWRRDNPHLISGDHSATALLARIQAERAKAPAKGRGRKSNQSQQG